MAHYRKIYYDKVSGKVIHQEGQPLGIIKTTLTQDYQTIKDLNERSIDTIALLELENDSYDFDFQQCGNNVTVVNPTTKELAFTYPAPVGPVTPEKPWSQQLIDLKSENSQLKQQIEQTNEDLVSLIEFFTSTIA